VGRAVAREARWVSTPAGSPRRAIDENVAAMEELISLGRTDRGSGRVVSK
jgi:hypothetical protein